MLSKSNRVATGVLLALVAVSTSMAGGFQVQQQGAKAAGRGNAFTAAADDASAVYYNPAAAARMEGWQLYLGGAAMFKNDTTFTAPDGTEYPMQEVQDYAGQVYVTGKLTDVYSVAFGANQPYSMRTHWWDSDPVAQDALKTRWTSQDLNFNFVVSLGEEWAFALGVDWVTLTINDFSSAYDFTRLQNFLLPAQEPYNAERNFLLEGNKAGWNLALHYKSDDGYVFGVSYRSQRIVRMEGHLRWQDVSEGGFVPGTTLIDPSGCGPVEPSTGNRYCPMGAAFTDSPAKASIVLPATMQIGFGRNGSGKWDWEVDILWTGWQNFNDITYTVDEINGVAQGLVAIPTTEDLYYREDWTGTVALFAGADVNFTDSHALRFGLSIDPTPVREPLTRAYNPSADRGALTLGYGFTSQEGHVKVDVFVQGWASMEVEASAIGVNGVTPGLYNTTEFTAGASFQYRF